MHEPESGLCGILYTFNSPLTATRKRYCRLPLQFQGRVHAGRALVDRSGSGLQSGSGVHSRGAQGCLAHVGQAVQQAHALLQPRPASSECKGIAQKQQFVHLLRQRLRRTPAAQPAEAAVPRAIHAEEAEGSGQLACNLHAHCAAEAAAE
ncbi:hypothetical protein TSOC_002638 [Tetrabaena socialis]|uniref:Uncharacterized protein n=1 Tax=Tetrabaena socialis TaxID=47790 RepID=A0A2J8ADL7_9CHLO|nr:hypothetical protein TSOC_002638 [Tetrabaena socialis]|eukprot:PNH10602.1 hypothetical protein TSOC_002638 [Tetrabaena socialis]